MQGSCDNHTQEESYACQSATGPRHVQNVKGNYGTTNFYGNDNIMYPGLNARSARSLGSLPCTDNIWDDRIEFVQPRSAFNNFQAEPTRSAWTSDRIPSFVRQGFLRGHQHNEYPHGYQQKYSYDTKKLEHLEERAREAERRAAEADARRAVLEKRVIEAERMAEVAQAREESAFRRAEATAATQLAAIDRARMEERVTLTARSHY